MEKDITKILNKYSFNVKLVRSAMSSISNDIALNYEKYKAELECEDDFYATIGLALTSKIGTPLKLILREVDSSVNDSLTQLAGKEKIDIVKYIKSILQNTINRLGYKDEVHSLFGKSAGANWKELNKLLWDYYIVAVGIDGGDSFSGIITKANVYYSVSSDEWVRTLKVVIKEGEYWVDWDNVKDNLIFLYFKI